MTVGVLLVIAGGALEGLFSLPVTRTPRWSWENIWGLGSLVALVLVPWPVAYWTVPELGTVFGQVEPGVREEKGARHPAGRGESRRDAGTPITHTWITAGRNTLRAAPSLACGGKGLPQIDHLLAAARRLPRG